MEQSTKAKFRAFVLLLMVSFYQTIAWAQDSTVTTKQVTTTTTEEHNWYTQPWVWVVAGAVFILLLVALIRSNSSTASSTDKVTVTKTVRRDSESV